MKVHLLVCWKDTLTAEVILIKGVERYAKQEAEKLMRSGKYTSVDVCVTLGTVTFAPPTPSPLVWAVP